MKSILEMVKLQNTIFGASECNFLGTKRACSGVLPLSVALDRPHSISTPTSFCSPFSPWRVATGEARPLGSFVSCHGEDRCCEHISKLATARLSYPTLNFTQPRPRAMCAEVQLPSRRKRAAAITVVPDDPSEIGRLRAIDHPILPPCPSPFAHLRLPAILGFNLSQNISFKTRGLFTNIQGAICKYFI